MKKSEISKRVIKRYESLVFNTDDCININKHKDQDGYGLDKVWFNKKNKTIKAHRLSYLIFNGDIPDSLFVCHSCDNPSCINPKHLWVGSCKQNLDDRNKKGRLNIEPSLVANIKRSKISHADVLTIRFLAEIGITQKAIAKLYGISKAHTCVIVNNKSRNKGR